MEQKQMLIGFAVLYVVTGVSIGVGLYYAGYNAYHPPEAKRDVSLDLQNEITAANINENLRNLSSVPHLAGTPQDKEQAEMLRDKFLEFGLDQAVIVPYDVLLSYPDMETRKPNKVYLKNSTQIVYSTSGLQTPLQAPEENSPLVAPNFNAYSRPGNVTANGLVYVHYGQQSDYDYLASQNISVVDKIVLARYGRLFRANIVELAERLGAIGVLLFSDPKDFAQDGRFNAYPDSWWMPGMAVQSGTVYLNNGDPLTPFYPAIKSAYHIPEEEALLPHICAQPIGYDEAEQLLSHLDGPEAPEEWRGDLEVRYSLGPNFKDPDMKIEMQILTKNKMVTTYNAIGVLLGEEEPDRYVLVGNHRDAWVLGAVDPSSGTASMIEMARAFGKIKTDLGWRPRRSIVFCSWGAEEYGLIGSYEWAEEHGKVLAQRAVAYLNVDIAVEGNYSLWGYAAPLMNNIYIESSKKVPNPDPEEVAAGRTTLFDTWHFRYPDAAHTEKPRIGILGSGSDYTNFMHILGVPSLDIRYTYKEDIGSYPLYHTLYETHYLLANLTDRGFFFHQAVTQLWAEIALNLAESVILPMDLTWYATYLKESFAQIKATYGAKITANGGTLEHFEASVNSFELAVQTYQNTTLKNIDVNDALAVRRVNDQLMQLERHFIDPHGLPNRPEYNHIVFAPSASDGYESSSFCGLTDLLEAVGTQSAVEKPTEWALIKQHLSVIAFFIEAAGRSLSDTL